MTHVSHKHLTLGVLGILVVFLGALGITRWSHESQLTAVPPDQQTIPPVIVPPSNSDTTSTLPDGSSTATSTGAATSTAPDGKGPIGILGQLSQNWKTDAEMGQHVEDLNAIGPLFPNMLDQSLSTPSDAIPGFFVHLLSLPMNNDRQILRVYLGCTIANLPNASNGLTAPACEDLSWQVRMARWDKITGKETFVGAIPVIHGANAGGLFMPAFVTKDDAHVILRAFMFSPGAGGGSVDYGYGLLPLQEVPVTADPVAEVPAIAPYQAAFYDSYGKVVFVDEGNNTPHIDKPGPANDAAIKYQNLVTGEKKTLFEEKDTSYRLLGVDEKTKQMTFEATSYRFSTSCPRQDNNLSCAATTKKTRTSILP